MKAPAKVELPDWVAIGTNLDYISRSRGDVHSVRVEKIEDRKQMVVIRFTADRKVWKRVPFAEIKKSGDGTLRPLWKKTEIATVPRKPADFVDTINSEDDKEQEEKEEMALPVDPTVEGPDVPSDMEDMAASNDEVDHANDGVQDMPETDPTATGVKRRLASQSPVRPRKQCLASSAAHMAGEDR